MRHPSISVPFRLFLAFSDTFARLGVQRWKKLSHVSDLTSSQWQFCQLNGFELVLTDGSVGKIGIIFVYLTIKSIVYGEPEEGMADRWPD